MINHPVLSSGHNMIYVNLCWNKLRTLLPYSDESGLVLGFDVEYAGGPFALFFLAEYANVIIINIFTTILFLGAYHNPILPELYSVNFTLKALISTILFLRVQASYPRFRYDQLIHLL